MINYNHQWIIVGFVIFLNVCSSNYIYQKIDKTLYDVKSIKFTMYILNFPGIILYTADQIAYKSLIKIEEIDGEMYFMVKTDSKMHCTKMNELCELKECSVNYVELEIEIKRDSMTTMCNKRMKQFLDPKDDTKDKLLDYPLGPGPNDSRVNFWMGNGFQNKTSNPERHQLFGCLDNLTVNTELKNFPKELSYFSSFCDRYYKNYILSQAYCSINSHNFSCSLPTTMVEDSVLKNGSSLHKMKDKYLVRTGSNEDFIDLQLTWTHFSNDNYCLMEMKFGKYSVVIQVLQSHVDMVFFNNGKEYERKILHKILNDSINDLTISFNNSQLMSVKVKDNKFSIECYHSIEEELELLNIGFVGNKSVCRTFSGKMNFRYNASQFEMETRKRDFNFWFYLKIVFLAGILTMTVVATFFIIFWIYLNHKIRDPNFYEPSPFPEPDKCPYEIIPEDIYEVIE